MEDEKKRKKNKKKKNKKTKPIDSVSGAVRESALSNHNHVNRTEHDEQKLFLESGDVQADSVQSTEVNLDRDCNNGTEGSLLAEDEKQLWLDKVANLEGNVSQLQKELDAHKHREADLESNIIQAQNEKVSCFKKPADLETIIMLLQTEKSSWLEKEASYEKRIDQLVNEATATSSSERLSLEEKIKSLETEKVSWVHMENTTNEMIASLDDDNTRLRAQVSELEASKSNLFDQNQQLTENIAGLRMQVQNLEIANADLSSGSTMSALENQQLESARALVGKLLSENAQLVEKVNELYIELFRRSVTQELSLSADSGPITGKDQITVITESSAHGTDPVVGSRETELDIDPLPSTGEGPASGTDPMTATERIDNARIPGHVFEIIKRTRSVERLDAVEENVIKPMSGVNYINDVDQEAIPYFQESVESSEIVQIPLDENEVKVTEVEAPLIDDKSDVPLTDAALIGAPFRLISYFARYFSGADLVNKSSKIVKVTHPIF